MFVYSMKASTLKFFGVILASVVVLVTLILLIPASDNASVDAASANYNKVKTNEDRIALLSGLGWQVSEQPVEEVQVQIPAEFDSVLDRYNSLQMDQGLDLSKYKRKTITRYTYQVTNYPDYEGTVYANLLVYRNKVVAGDLCSASADGFVSPLSGD